MFFPKNDIVSIKVSIENFILLDKESVQTQFIPIQASSSYLTEKSAIRFDQHRYPKLMFFRNYKFEFLNPGLNRKL